MQKGPSRAGNALLAQLPADQYRRLIEQCELVTDSPGKVLSEAERKVEYVFFPVTAVASILSVMTDRSAVETAVVGNEGMTPIAAFHGGSSAAEHVIVQVPGELLRMRLETFQSACATYPELRHALHRFSQALFTFAAQSSACNRKHSVVQRCARWLLTTHDRVPGDEFELTHLFLAQMLGVRRSSVTVAAEALRAAGAITYSRGRVEIVDRELLHSKSCPCYDVIRSTYDRLIEGRGTHSPLYDLTLSNGDVSLVHAGEPGRSSPAEGVSVISRDALAELNSLVRRQRDHNADLRSALAHADRRDDGTDATHELSIALEQLQVAEEALRAQMEALLEMHDVMESEKERWRSRFDGLPDAFIETDQNDTILEVNRAAEELLGRSRRQLIGKPLAMLIAESDRHGFRDVISNLRRADATSPWTGRLAATDANAAIDITVSVSRTPHGSSGVALALTREHRGQYIGARWLVRTKSAEATRSS